MIAVRVTDELSLVVVQNVRLGVGVFVGGERLRTGGLCLSQVHPHSVNLGRI